MRNADRVVRQWRPAHQEQRLFRPAQRRAASHVLGGPARRARTTPSNGGATSSATSRPAISRARDLARFEAEALDGVAAGLAAAREPRRKLMRAGGAPPRPPPFLPSRRAAASDGFVWRWSRRTIRRDRTAASLATSPNSPRPGRGSAITSMSSPARGARRAWISKTASGFIAPRSRAGPPPPDLVATARNPAALWDHSRTMFDEVAKLDARRRVDFVYAPLWDCEPLAFLSEPRFPLILRVANDDGFLARFAAGTARRSRMDAQPAARRCSRSSVGFWRPRRSCTPTAAPSSRIFRAATR